MDDLPKRNAMDDTLGKRLSGLDPAELLKQGAAEDTITECDSGGFTPPTPEELVAIFPRFEVLELIGKGGMGAVYKVRQPELDRIVALKILHPEISDSESFSTRFTREAKALAKLSHPGIVTIHESGHEGALYYFLMEYVDGVNLRQLLENGRISPREAMAIVPQICDALQFAHDQGVVHRDIKPENLLIDRLGRVKVADFGIAKLIGSDDPATASLRSEGTMFTDGGKILGTPQYMAPEQGSKPSEVDHRADIFALGVVFYQMLTGELPDKDLKPPSQKVTLDVRLDEVVLRALEKDPSLRFSNATEMKTRIEDAASTVTEEPKRKENPKPETKSRKRVVLLVLAILAGLILIPSAILLLLWMYFTPVSKKTEGGSSARSENVESLERMETANSIPFHSGKLFGGNEMTVIDLAAGKTFPLGDEIFEDVDFPDFCLSYHLATTSDGASGRVVGTRQFLNTTADFFAWRQMPVGFLPEKGYAQADPKGMGDFITPPKDDSGTSSVEFDPEVLSAHWYNFRINLEDGRRAQGYIRLANTDPENLKIEWTFRKYPKPKPLKLVRNEELVAQYLSLQMKVIETSLSLGTRHPKRLKAIESLTSFLEQHPELQNTPIPDDIREREKEALQATLSELGETLRDSHPEVLKTQRKLDWLSSLGKTDAAEANTEFEIEISSGELHLLNGESIEQDEILNQIEEGYKADPNIEIRLKADPSLNFSKVRSWMEKLSALGVTKIIFTADSTPHPELRRLDWQDQVKACMGEAWLPSGEIDNSTDWFPPITGVENSRFDAEGEIPRFLCLWFSHPLIDDLSTTRIRLFREDGKTPLDIPVGSFSINRIPESDENGGTGWITATLCAGRRTGFPKKAVVSLGYSLGEWDFVNEIPVNYRGTKSIGNGTMINGPGQDSDGNAFIQITSESRSDTKDIQFDFVAITDDGRRLESNRRSSSSAGDASFQRFTFTIPLAELRSFECRKRPIREMTWPVVLRDDTRPEETMDIEFDLAGDSMQNIVHRLRREYGFRICFENLNFTEDDATKLGDRISALEEAKVSCELSEREGSLLESALRLRNVDGVGDESVIDLGDRFEGEMKAAGIEDFLDQLTEGTRYRWAVGDGGGTWMILPREESVLDFPVSLDTAGLSIIEAVEKVIAQCPAGSSIELAPTVRTGPVAPTGYDSMPWQHVRCQPAELSDISALEALNAICENAILDSLWEVSGFDGKHTIGISRGTGSEHQLISEAQAWLIGMDGRKYAEAWDSSSAFVKKSLTRDAWKEAMETARTPLGKAETRQLISASNEASLPDSPDGEYLVLQFESDFSNKKDSVETLTLMRESDGKWRIASYIIN